MRRLRRIAAAAGCAALMGAGCGEAQPRRDAGAGVAGDSRSAVARSPGEAAAQQRARVAARAAWKRRELRAIAGSTTVGAALRRAWLRGSIDGPDHAAYRAAYAGARLAASRLSGARAAEQAAVVALVERLALEGKLAPSRLPAVFLNLRRNTRTWTQAPFPAAGERRTFGRHPAVFQYVPGHGVQLHPLATWGRVNGRLRRCLLTRGRRCAERELRRDVDALSRLAAGRGGFSAWEYLYPYAQGSPPWISGMAQATAVQALSRAAYALDRPRYAKLADRALGAFSTPPPTGVGVADPGGGSRFVMYSFAPSLRILNGELQAINGLRDAAVIGRNARAAALVRAGDRAARAVLPGFDTGAWSLYSAAGGESTLAYHRLTTGILGELCRRTRAVAYCESERRFAQYAREPPRIALAALRDLHARRAAALRFTLSKGSSVQVRVSGPRGLVLARDLELGRGGHDLSWTPPSRGRFTVRVAARGPEGLMGTADASVRVRLPKPKRRPRPEPRRPERTGEAGEALPGLLG